MDAQSEGRVCLALPIGARVRPVLAQKRSPHPVLLRYDVTATFFEGDCDEQLHSPDTNPAAIANGIFDQLDHFERGSCSPGGWFDFYFNVTSAIVAAGDNLLFEVEVLGGIRNNDAVRLLSPP